MTALTLGFIPLTDAAPLIVAENQGYFADEGLDIALSREASWATIRDKVAVGALDGAHMLAPLALAATAGITTPSASMLAPLSLAANGAAITLSSGLLAALGEDGRTPLSAAAGLAHIVSNRKATGEAPLVFAVVFPFSIHNYMLRHWLAQAGIDPDQDVRLVTAPPPRMVEKLSSGEIDGFCVGAPWNAVALQAGLGRAILRSSQFWPGAPDKVFGVTQAFAQEDAGRLQAVLRALIRAQAWADAPENRAELIALLALPQHVDAAPEAIALALDDELVFQAAALPRLEQAQWLLRQMLRWRQIGAQADRAALAARVYRPDLAMTALTKLGMAKPGPPAESVPKAALLYDGTAFDA